MKGDRLQTFHFLLETSSPIHLGCGEVYDPTSFVIDEEEGRMTVVSPEELILALDSEQRKKFSDICRKGTPESIIEIFRFLHGNCKHVDWGQHIEVSPQFARHYAQNLELRGRRIQQELNRFQIERTAYRSVDHLPYVPGSAVKGAIRTAVLNRRFKVTPGHITGKRKVEEVLLGGSFGTDPFRLIKVSDFSPVNRVGRVVKYAVNKKKKPTEQSARGPAQILETIKPGVGFLGSITVQLQGDSSGKKPVEKPLDIRDVQSALEEFYSVEKKREMKELARLGVAASLSGNDSGAGWPIRLGRHSGAECLTIDGMRQIKIMLGKGKTKLLDRATTLWLASSDRVGSHPEHLLPFGWAVLRPLTSEEAREYRQKQQQNMREMLAEREKLVRIKNERAKADRLKAQALLEEKRRREEAERLRQEEERKYPWRKFFSLIDSVTDWGRLKDAILNDSQIASYKGEVELAQKVAAAATRVVMNNPRKWDHEREEMVSEWLASAGLEWTSGFLEEAPVTLTAEQCEVLERIKAIKDLGQFDASGLVIDQLDRMCLERLRNHLQQLGWKKKPPKKKAKKSQERRYELYCTVLRRLEKLS